MAQFTAGQLWTGQLNPGIMFHQTVLRGLWDPSRRVHCRRKRIDRTLLEDPVLKLKFQNSVADFIDAAQKGQYAGQVRPGILLGQSLGP